MKKVLLVGDGGAPTGFARVNDHLVSRLRDDGWHVSWLAINMNGDAHPLQKIHDVYPASLGGADPVGIERIRGCVEHVRPDLIVMNGDCWTLGAYLDNLRDLTPKPTLLGYVPPDSPNQAYGHKLNDIDLLMCPTQFGVDALRLGGYTGEAIVVPYGVDRSIYRPLDQTASREALGFPTDAVIFGRADRNAKRKRHDLTLEIFKRFVDEVMPDGAYLHLHCAPRDVGWDLPQLVKYYGLERRVFFTAQDLVPNTLVPQERLPQIFSAWTAHWSTTMGEGFGLVALESAACGAAQILPDWSAYGEWMKDGAYLVPCDRVLATDGGINTLGGLVDEDECLTGLDVVARNAEFYRKKALDVAGDPRYDWQNVLGQFSRAVEGLCG